MVGADEQHVANPSCPDGVAIEDMIALANQAHVSPGFACDRWVLRIVRQLAAAG